MYSIGYGRQQTYDGFSDLVSRFTLHFSHQTELRFALRERNDGLLMAFTNDRVQFPVAISRATINDARALINRDAIC